MRARRKRRCNSCQQGNQHLVDLKARNKIAIFYPRMGDEKDLIEEIST
jgi:hypothetical protein